MMQIINSSYTTVVEWQCNEMFITDSSKTQNLIQSLSERHGTRLWLPATAL